ncbi:hypothetical protein ACIRQT_13500 [Streptomyces californicus]|uniref:hypothetical protein n=1 Tax=Streptomyces californicus TaxID=67351 RepID=UPI00381AA3DA
MSQLSKPEASGVVAATAMFVEVLVIGIGGLAGVFGCLAAVAGYANMRGISTILSSAPASAVALSAAYALGIVVDRAADHLLAPPRRRLRRRYFSTDSSYDEARKTILEFPNLVAMSDYARSRMRICRGWLLDCLLLVLAASLLVWRFPVQHRLILFIAVIVLGGVCSAGFYLCWRSITATGYKKLAQQATHAAGRVPNQGGDVAANT